MIKDDSLRTLAGSIVFFAAFYIECLHVECGVKLAVLLYSTNKEKAVISARIPLQSDLAEQWTELMEDGKLIN